MRPRIIYVENAIYIRYLHIMDKPAAPAEICEGSDCLFDVKKAPFGVRQRFHNYYRGDYWQHHAWGISTRADAQLVLDQVNR